MTPLSDDPTPAECRQLRDHALYAFARVAMALGPMCRDVVSANEGAEDREDSDVLDVMAASLWAALEPLRPYIKFTPNQEGPE